MFLSYCFIRAYSQGSKFFLLGKDKFFFFFIFQKEPIVQRGEQKIVSPAITTKIFTKCIHFTVGFCDKATLWQGL